MKHSRGNHVERMLREPCWLLNRVEIPELIYLSLRLVIQHLCLHQNTSRSLLKRIAGTTIRVLCRDLPRTQDCLRVPNEIQVEILLFLGHCGKTFVILRHYVNSLNENSEDEGFSWLVIADDDTLLSIPRLAQLLSCYGDDEKVVTHPNIVLVIRLNMITSAFKVILGERYGYGFSNSGRDGYDYPTGGSGMVFSSSAAKAIVSGCDCPAYDSPDDMIIGICARRSGIVIVHSAAFHQARPIDYPQPYLRRILPISFHKFDDVDPYQVYIDYLSGPSTFEIKNKQEL
ncbi:hypothetical protein ANCCAN_26456 [Ancylostoma caninum]|uniref:Fringe-like glycosyltransferase domain-containing protein n=1 Tax=Ancylostoma caninum TaxID=29170 RepID=A0A368FCB1_ANCCA|nr:hypothetical protein ANCCAN_26456 [Ancylostoma caninum]